MVAHDYDIQLDGTRIDTIVEWVRLIKYTAGAKRPTDAMIPFRHGELHIPDKYFTAADVQFEVGLPRGTASEIAQGLSDVTAYFGQQIRPVFSFNDPFRGDIRASLDLTTEPIPTQDRFTYLFTARNAKGFWEAVAASNAVSANPPVVTTGGDRPVDDAILTFAGIGFLQHTDELGQISRVEMVTGAGGTTPYIVDCAAGTAVDSAGSPADKGRWLLYDKPWVMKFSPGAAQSFTANVAVEVDWRNKWG